MPSGQSRTSPSSDGVRATGCGPKPVALAQIACGGLLRRHCEWHEGESTAPKRATLHNPSCQQSQPLVVPATLKAPNLPVVSLGILTPRQCATSVDP